MASPSSPLVRAPPYASQKGKEDQFAPRRGALGDVCRRVTDPAVLSLICVAVVVSNLATYYYMVGQALAMSKIPLEIIREAPSSRFTIDPYPLPGPISWECLSPAARDQFTMGNKIPVQSTMKDEDQEKTGWRVGKAQFQKLLDAAASRDPNATLCMYGPYCNRVFFQALEAHPVKAMEVLIVGTQWPWLEAMCISFGAKSVTTVDFNKPSIAHPRVKTLSVPELEDLHFQYDMIFSYSSLEHDGLGRYGDALDPDGDLQRMKKLRGLLKPGGKLYLGVPNGQDYLVFNLHRVYGPMRFPLLVEGWKLLDTFGVTEEQLFLPKNGKYIQPVHVLRAA